MTKRSAMAAGFTLAVAALLTLSASAASAQQYQPVAAQILSDYTVVAGQTITVSGFGCPPGSPVSTGFNTTGQASTTASASGTYTLQFRIPSNAALGLHQIISTCKAAGAGDRVTLTSTVRVVAAGTSGTGGVTTAPGATSTGSNGRLAFTGTNSVVPMLRLGLGLLAAGGLLLVVARKRHTATPA